MKNNSIDFSPRQLFIFDLQQTLLNDFQAHLDAHEKILKKNFKGDIKGALDEVIHLWGMSVFDVYKKLFKDGVSDEKIRQLVEARDQHYIEIFTNSEPTLCKGARELLVYLKAHKYPIAVVSGSKRKLVNIALEKSHIMSFVDFIVGGDEVTQSKPNPEGFLKAADHFKLQPERCLMIGDSFLDIEGAKNAGMKAVGVLTGFTKKEQLLESGADFVVRDLEELFILLKNDARVN